MGILRLIFALAVVFGHSWLGGPVFVGGKNAVQLFYMISGFLISYVLVEAKSYATVVDFYKSRALRIYPVYAVVAVITLLAMFILGNSVFLDVYRNAPVTAGAFLAATNVFVLGQDWVMFLGVTGGKLVATGDFSDSEVLLYNGLLVPQAWTLGVELSFYALAPFVLRQRRRLFAMFALSVCVRLVLVAMGIASEDPWRYRFFAAELSLFLLGALAHQFLLPMYLTLPAKRLSQASLAATTFLVVFSLSHWLLPVPGAVKTPLLFVSFALLLPLTFTFQATHSWDSRLGNLSYPVYICHILVIMLSAPLVGHVESIAGGWLVAIGHVALAIVAAVALNRFVAEPVERVRQRIKRRASAACQG